MSRILLADDSPHAQRMGERILSEEGFEVVTVSDGDSALVRLEDVDPDLVLADAIMPKRSGYELCQYVKISPRHRHTRVIITLGALEELDEAEVQRVRADAVLRKPFEASVLIEAARPLLEAAVRERPPEKTEMLRRNEAGRKAVPGAPVVALIDAEMVRAAVTVALDASMPHMIEEITEKVLAALTGSKHA